jgi:hypothetical protein
MSLPPRAAKMARLTLERIIKFVKVQYYASEVPVREREPTERAHPKQMPHRRSPTSGDRVRHDKLLIWVRAERLTV